jgi:hypothetical protein
MTKLVLSTILSAAATLFPIKSAASDTGQPGFTLKQWSAAMVKSGIDRERVYSILTFRNLGDPGEHIAILSGFRSGWHVTVFNNIAGGLKIEWKSGGMRSDFSVSSPDELEIDDLGDEQVVEFSGCAPHMCGGIDGGEFGMVLYAPRVGQAFFAHYSYDDKKPRGSFGSLDFSDNALSAGNERYKAALDRAMKQKLRVGKPTDR